MEQEHPNLSPHPTWDETFQSLSEFILPDHIQPTLPPDSTDESTLQDLTEFLKNKPFHSVNKEYDTLDTPLQTEDYPFQNLFNDDDQTVNRINHPDFTQETQDLTFDHTYPNPVPLLQDLDPFFGKIDPTLHRSTPNPQPPTPIHTYPSIQPFWQHLPPIPTTPDLYSVP